MARRTQKKRGARRHRTSRRGGVWPFDGISAALFGGPKDPNVVPKDPNAPTFFGTRPPSPAPPAGMTVRTPGDATETDQSAALNPFREDTGGRKRRGRGGKKSRRR